MFTDAEIWLRGYDSRLTWNMHIILIVKVFKGEHGPSVGNKWKVLMKDY